MARTQRRAMGVFAGAGLGLWLMSELVDVASGSVVEPPVVLAVSAAFMLGGGDPRLPRADPTGMRGSTGGGTQGG